MIFVTNLVLYLRIPGNWKAVRKFNGLMQEIGYAH